MSAEGRRYIKIYTKTGDDGKCKLTLRAYPGSEFDVANTLAKWKKLEPNEIDLSQGFSQKVVSRSCSVFNSLAASGDFCHLLITLQTVWTQIRPDILLGLIWIQTV